VPQQRPMLRPELCLHRVCEVIGEGVLQCARIIGNLEDSPGCCCVIQARFEGFNPILQFLLQKFSRQLQP
jgi:hypothetical protein